MKLSPCKDCSGRYAECHSRCERYSAWKTEHEELHEEINKKKKADRDYYDHRVDYAVKCAKKRGAMK